MSISIFKNSRTLSSAEIVRETLSFIIDDNGGLAVSLQPTREKVLGLKSSPSSNFLNILML